ncbi:Glycoside hydrolase, 38 vacuolar alpha mannosidase [Tulasnella sp. 425]|nr:Glycoside hydrolase, 38 vacuolar alpha mannosidase [Tulasnella sp. 425]
MGGGNNAENDSQKNMQYHQPISGCCRSHSYPETNYTPGGKWIKGLTHDRLGVFVGGHFDAVNLGAVLFAERIDDDKHIQMVYWSAPGRSKPGFDEVMKLDKKEWKEAKKGLSFGPSYTERTLLQTNHWLKVHLKLPSDWDKKYERIQFEFDPSCEAMIFETDGNPLQGITGSNGGDRRVDFIIPKDARHKGELDIVIEVSCNEMFGVSGIGAPDPNRYFTLNSADLVVPNQEAWRLLWDFTTLRELVDDLPGNSILQNLCLVTANKIMNTFDIHDPERTIKECRKIAEDVFGEGWDAKGADIYKEGLGKGKKAQVWGIGNCHIDTAWLWPFSVTQQKAARSWSTQIDLMERYPEHRFATSSAQQFKWVEQLYPKLHERIKEKVKTGQFQLVGGSWVENDSNMPSGEALARQMIYGQRYFRSRFGVTSKVAWLPDSFGLSGALPQLIRGAGMENFFTQKLSWNNVNTFPHSTFNWVGLDGTQVICHMTPVDTYTAQATVADVRRGIWNHKNLESSDTGLLAFGNGDGGGGPLNKMLENLRRIRATGNEHRELPVVSMGESVDDFYDDIHKHTDEGKALPVWRGELYLEFHRGTYTSHGSIKKGNRHSETLMRDVEYLATLASLLKPEKYSYPKDTIDTCWEKVLLNQFHDVLPGSAIGMVYVDAEQNYAEVARDGRKMIHDALSVLIDDSKGITAPMPYKDYKASGGQLAAVNTLDFPRLETVMLPVTGSSEKTVALDGGWVQPSKKGDRVFAVVGAQGRSIGGVETPNLDDGVGATGKHAPRQLQFALDETINPPCPALQTDDGSFVLKNASVEFKISKGRVVSLVDRELGRELIPGGATGGLVMFERDTPPNWDAWDTEIHHLETSKPLEFSNLKVHESGPLRASLVADIAYGQSKIWVEISLDATSATTQANSRPYIRFDAKVDWHERHKFLKFELPLDIHSDIAYYECAFGWVSRPTHRNTTQEAAKFEVCGHRYADLSEFGYGVALLTESKYGYATTGNVMRVSLLRGPTSPDNEQDQGVRHVSSSNTESLLHTPPFRVEGAPSVILDTVKRGDDDDFSGSSTDKTLVLRLYEAYGGHARPNIRIAKYIKVHKALITNLLEEEIEEVKLIGPESAEEGCSIPLSMRGFQVVTVKLFLEDTADGAPRRSNDSWVDVGKI